MKIKRLKKITIGDTTFNIRWDGLKGDGEFCYPSPVEEGYIRIGTAYSRTNPESVFTILLHELKEIIQIEQGTRLRRPIAGGDYGFHYGHAEHTDLCNRLSGLLYKFIK